MTQADKNYDRNVRINDPAACAIQTRIRLMAGAPRWKKSVRDSEKPEAKAVTRLAYRQQFTTREASSRSNFLGVSIRRQGQSNNRDAATIPLRRQYQT